MTDGHGRATSRRIGRFAVRLTMLLCATAGLTKLERRAHAGGFEGPGIGVEAMGRGGAFTAKADDGTALEYNIAGLARQRGTRLLIDGKLVLNSGTFQRAGSYPVENNSMGNPQPWSGIPYPQVSNENGISGAPVIALSSDFGYFDRWTFAIGLTTPSASDSNRTYPTTVNGNWPAPQRYDVTQVNLLVVYPMLAAAVRITKWFDLGLALQLVYGHFDLKSAAFADLGSTLCPGAEFSGCDSILNLKTTGFTATGALGMMFHPLKQLHIGLNVRGPVYLNTSGDVTATSPAALPAPIDPGTVTLDFHLPWVVRLGVRYAFMEGRRERGDIEIDGTYESWKQAEGTGDPLKIPALGPFVDISSTILHHYKDTGSVRVGGAYNGYLKNDMRLTARAGLFYDSAATNSAYTRLDFDTLDKIGVGVGLGFHIRGVTINAAYNYIASPKRTVTDGRQQVLNGTNGSTQLGNGDPTPVFNNGTYTSATQLISLGISVDFDEALKKKTRKDPFGDPDMPGWGRSE